MKIQTVSEFDMALRLNNFIFFCHVVALGDILHLAFKQLVWKVWRFLIIKPS